MSNKITSEELEVIKKQQLELNTVVNNIGVIESQKHSLLHRLADINVDLEKVKKDLEDKYGSISIDLETGEYTDVEQENVLTKVVDNEDAKQ